MCAIYSGPFEVPQPRAREPFSELSSIDRVTRIRAITHIWTAPSARKDKGGRFFGEPRFKVRSKN